MLSLIGMVKSFMGRLRWKACHILNPSDSQQKETYGFNTIKPPPRGKNNQELNQSLALIEKNMLNLVSNVKFRKKTNDFQMKLNEDSRNIHNDPKLFIAADKTSNYYKVSNERQKSLLKRDVEKD